MDLPMITKLKELELENARLKKMYAEERLRDDILKAVLKKVKKPSLAFEMAKIISEEKDISISTVCKIFCVNEICYRYKSTISSEDDVIASWLMHLVGNQKNWGFVFSWLFIFT